MTRFGMTCPAIFCPVTRILRFLSPAMARPAVLAVALGGLVACGEKPPTTDPAPASPKAATASAPSVTAPPAAPPAAAPPPFASEATRPSLVSRDAIGLKHAGVPASLDDHPWDSEHWNETAGHRLKALAGLLESPSTLDAAAVDGFLAPGFRSTLLKPEDLTERAVPPLTVRRFDGPPAAAEETGAAAFADRLKSLVAGVPDVREMTTLIKIFRVSTDPPETTARLELVARNGEVSVQQVAHWHCRWETDAPGEPRLTSVVVEAFEETITPAVRTFVDATGPLLDKDPAFRDQLAHGLDHWVARLEQEYVFGPSGWEGVAMGDANGDGLEDLYVCQPGGLPNRLFVQNPDGSLTDRAAVAGVDWWDQSQAAVFADLDNDGDQDLAVSMMWGVLVLANGGSGAFTPAAAVLSPEGMPYSLAAADFDADGDLDLYVCCYGKRGTAVEQRFLARPQPYHDADNGSRNMLLRNDRSFRFRDVTRASGLDENNRRFSFAAAWEDYDNDGDLDLYVANDFGRNNLYRCERSGHTTRFRDVAADAGVEDISAGMSASWGDADADGRPDLYVSNMWSSAGHRVTYQRRFRENSGQRAAFQRHARGNSLFRNAGDGTFHDLSEPAGVTMGRWAWGSRFTDLNNDGRDDLLVANGYITQPDPGDL